MEGRKTAAAGGAMSRFVLFLLASIAAVAQAWDGVERVVAVGDVHGSYSEFTTVLRYAGLLETSKDKWAGGKAHLVQLGDIPDRGPDTRRIFDLLMDLEKQAKKAGGMVHPLIGNHEAMNIYGDLRYTVPEEFASFRRPHSEEIRNQIWLMQSAELKAKGQGDKLTAEYRSEWEGKYPPGYFEHRFEFGPNGKYGRWIRKHDSVIRINDTLFVHGGISPKYSGQSLKDMNDQVRRELDSLELLNKGMVVDSEGPLWYRGLALSPEPELEQHVSNLLKSYGVKRVVIGHTRTIGAILTRFDGRVVLADVGLSAVYGSKLACVTIEGDRVMAIHRGVPLALPTSQTGTVAYLKKVAGHDPSPAKLLSAAEAMQSSSVVELETKDDDPDSSPENRSLATRLDGKRISK